jgi:two-component system phosphate regulon sensor histidine kinase PhoR
MTLLAFLLGLIIGIGFWFWQKRQLQRQLGQMLGSLQTDASSTSLPVVSRLRREIALANEHREGLEEELQLWQRLLQVAPLGYLQVDEENQLLWCNEQARQLLQIDRWEPRQIRLLLELVRSFELDQLIEKTRQRQQPDIREWVFHPPCLDGAAMSEVRSLTLRASSWPLPQGQVGVFLENRQPLVELSQSRNQWFSDLAHELRTPLTSIRLVAEALQGRLKPPASRWVEQLLHETNRLINLVQDWLELSNLEKNPSISLSYQPVELRSLIQSTWQTLEPLAQLHQLYLVYSGPDILWLRADEARLTQVFLNLFDNSIKHSPPGAEIWVDVTCFEAEEAEDSKTEALGDRTTPTMPLKPTYPVSLSEARHSPAERDQLLSSSASDHEQAAHLELEKRGSIQIDIIDSGAGFSESDLPHVFERLYRGDASRHKQQTPVEGLATPRGNTGSGLGLSIVLQIIQAHNGTVKASNHPETGGAWLQIKLPESKPSL